MTFDRLIDFGTLTTLLGIGLVLTAVSYVMFVLAGWARAALHSYAQRDLRPDEPRCLKCRYIVKHVTTPFCPECGANLEEGTLLPTKCPPISPRVLGALLTSIFLPGPLLVCYCVIGGIIPACNLASWSVSGKDRAVGDVNKFTGLYEISVKASGRGNAINFVAEGVMIEIVMEKEPSWKTRDMYVIWQSRICLQSDQRGAIDESKPGVPFDRQCIVEFLRNYPAQPGEDTAEVLADEVMLLIDTVAAGKRIDFGAYERLIFGRSTSSITLNPPWGFYLAFLVASIFVHALTARTLTRRIAARRARSTSAVTPSQPPVT